MYTESNGSFQHPRNVGELETPAASEQWEMQNVEIS